MYHVLLSHSLGRHKSYAAGIEYKLIENKLYALFLFIQGIKFSKYRKRNDFTSILLNKKEKKSGTINIKIKPMHPHM